MFIKGYRIVSFKRIDEPFPKLFQSKSAINASIWHVAVALLYIEAKATCIYRYRHKIVCKKVYHLIKQVRLELQRVVPYKNVYDFNNNTKHANRKNNNKTK